MRWVMWSCLLSGCVVTVEDEGLPCFTVPENVPGTLSVEVRMGGGEDAPVAASCTLYRDAGALVLRTERTFRPTPFIDLDKVPAPNAHCSAPVDSVGPLTVRFRGDTVLIEVPGGAQAVCFEQRDDGSLVRVDTGG